MINRVLNKKKEILKKYEDGLNYLISACKSPLESLFLLEIFASMIPLKTQKHAL
jgi:hypothetical protein